MGGKKPDKKDPAEKAAEAAAKAQKYMVKACQEDNVKSLESAVKKGASMTEPDQHGNTPLHVAAMYGSCHAIAYLHAHGADENARNKAGHDQVPPKPGRTPLESATKVGEPRAVALLSALAEGRTFDLDEELSDSDEELELPKDESITTHEVETTDENNTTDSQTPVQGGDEPRLSGDADGGTERTIASRARGQAGESPAAAQPQGKQASVALAPNSAAATAALEALSLA